MKTINDDEFVKALKSKSVDMEPEEEEEEHPYLKHLKTLETLMQSIASSTDAKESLAYLTKTIADYQMINTKLIKQIADLQEQFMQFSKADNAEVWIADVEKRDGNNFLKKVRFSKYANKS